MLITEGTMLSREGEIGHTLVKSEQELGERAEELFQKHKYNFVLVSSTNLDSIMEFYHSTPEGMHFVCDLYQARILITAMRDMERKGKFPEYQPSKKHPVVRVLGKGDSRWAELQAIGNTMENPLYFKAAREKGLEQDGFVLLARKNARPGIYTSPFETLRDKFFERDGQIIYSMWTGYLKGEHADKALIRFIGGRPVEFLHTSGHVYVETIAKLIETVDPKWIIPMHTERAEEFSAIPEFVRWKSQVKVLKDGRPLDLDTL